MCVSNEARSGVCAAFRYITLACFYRLNASFNMLEALPSDFGHQKSLRLLQLSKFSLAWRCSPRSVRLDVDGNPWLHDVDIATLMESLGGHGTSRTIAWVAMPAACTGAAPKSRERKHELEKRTKHQVMLLLRQREDSRTSSSSSLRQQENSHQVCTDCIGYYLWIGLNFVAGYVAGQEYGKSNWKF